MLSSIWDDGKLRLWEMQLLTKELYFPLGWANQPLCTRQQRTERHSLSPSDCFAEARRIPTAMKRNHVWDLCFFGRKHRYWWNKCVIALAMDKIPLTMFDNGIHFRRDMVITLRRPGSNTNDTHSFDHHLLGKRSREGMWHSCQKCDIDTITREAASDFMDMRLYTADVRKIACSYHQYIQHIFILSSVRPRHLWLGIEASPFFGWIGRGCSFNQPLKFMQRYPDSICICFYPIVLSDSFDRLPIFFVERQCCS